MPNKEGGLLPDIGKDSISERMIHLPTEFVRCEEEDRVVATGTNPIGEDYAYPLLPQEIAALGNEQFKDATYIEKIIRYSRTVAIISGQGPFGGPYFYAVMSVKPEYYTEYHVSDCNNYRYDEFNPHAERRDIVDLNTGKLFEDYQYGSPRGNSTMLFGDLEELNRMRAKAGLEELDKYRG